jgi:hypothetical protein
MQRIILKEEPNAISHNSKLSNPITKSSLIDLCDSFDKDGLSLLDVVPIFVN